MCPDSEERERARDPKPRRAPVASNLPAIEQAYAAHIGEMRRIARSILRNAADAEDLVHDVFVEACEKWDQYDATRGSRRSWLVVRLRSRAIDRLRRQSRICDGPVPVEEAAPEDPCTPLRAIEGRRAWKLLDTLPDGMRRVVRLRLGEGLSVAETAERIGVPAGTVKSRQSNGIRALRARLEETR